MPPKAPAVERTLSAFFVKGAEDRIASPPGADPLVTDPPATKENPTPKTKGGRGRSKMASESQGASSKLAQGKVEVVPRQMPSKEDEGSATKPKVKRATKPKMNPEVVIPPHPKTSPKRTKSSAATLLEEHPPPSSTNSESTPVTVEGGTGHHNIGDDQNAQTLLVKGDAPSQRNPSGPSTATQLSSAPGALVTNSAAGGASSALSKLNKIDSASMIKVRSGKAYITENKLKFSTHPSAVTELCRFHDYRQQLQEAQDLSLIPGVQLEGDHVDIKSIPVEHFGLIAKLVEESELLLSDLATSMVTTLCPMGFEGFGEESTSSNAHSGGQAMDVDADIDIECLGELEQRKRSATTVSPSAIMEAIQAVAQRVNYGVPVSNLPGACIATPPNLSVFRWETRDIEQHFPKDMRAAVMKRRKKRMEFSAALTAWFLGLEPKQQEDLCPAPVTTVRAMGVLGALSTPESASSSSTKRHRVSVGAEMMEVDGDMSALVNAVSGAEGAVRMGLSDSAVLMAGQSTVAATVDPAILEMKLKEAEAKKKEAEAKEERRLEKERKIAERQLEKDLKEAEKLQKEEVKKRKAEEERLKKEQTSQRFVGFFKLAASPSIRKDCLQATVKSDATPASLLDLFHPFYIKKDTSLAPISRFTPTLTRDEIDQQLSASSHQNFGGNGNTDMEVDLDEDAIPPLSAKRIQTLSNIFSAKTKWTTATSDEVKARLPLNYRSMTVKDLMHSGLLLQDDMSHVLHWKAIPALRMRLLQFAENFRPAYYGTWSKQSKAVTGRRFLGKDTEWMDYEVDSEAEWEEDEEGEECKSDDEEDDQDDVGSEQEDEDDWLVPEGYLSDDEGLDAGEEGSHPDPSSLMKTKDLKRPATAHSAPLIVGPIFEVILGETCSHPTLDPYHIEFIGDFGYGMDLFHATDSSVSTPAAASAVHAL